MIHAEVMVGAQTHHRTKLSCYFCRPIVLNNRENCHAERFLVMREFRATQYEANNQWLLMDHGAQPTWTSHHPGFCSDAILPMLCDRQDRRLCRTDVKLGKCLQRAALLDAPKVPAPFPSFFATDKVPTKPSQTCLRHHYTAHPQSIHPTTGVI